MEWKQLAATCAATICLPCLPRFHRCQWKHFKAGALPYLVCYWKQTKTPKPHNSYLDVKL